MTLASRNSTSRQSSIPEILLNSLFVERMNWRMGIYQLLILIFIYEELVITNLVHLTKIFRYESENQSIKNSATDSNKAQSSFL